jgi:hypothetical protein
MPGAYLAMLTVCDAYGQCASGTLTVHVAKRNTTLGSTGATSGVFHTATTLSGSLVDQLGLPVNGRTVSFAVGTDGPFSVSTNSSGVASTSSKPRLAAGSYAITASFAGDSLYNASSSSNTFVESQQATSITYTGATFSHPNKAVTLSATLVDAGGAPLAGRTVSFVLGSQSATAVTNAQRVAVTTMTVSQKNGIYTVTATYDPTANPPDASYYLGSTQSSARSGSGRLTESTREPEPSRDSQSSIT